MRRLPGEVMRGGERAAVGLSTTCSRSSITTSSTSAAPERGLAPALRRRRRCLEWVVTRCSLRTLA